jgi:asparagine synthase (glutamine-hydrolysing)
MSAIAGIITTGKQLEVEQMLDRQAHRGQKEKVIIDVYGATIGFICAQASENPVVNREDEVLVRDYTGSAHYAQVLAAPNKILLERDPLGLAPLYYGWTEEGFLCFASEVKALLPQTRKIYQLPPGSRFDGEKINTYFRLEKQPELSESPEEVAAELRSRLENATMRCLGNGEVGSWLSGGLDSSTIAALACRYVDHLHTFSAGLATAEDLIYAREVASFLRTDHHEVIVTIEEMLAVLPQVIYHLESFDPLLVRSSITNYMVAKRASDFVPAVFSGEGGDELFAGYEYLKSVAPEGLADELIDITGRLHNTALSRVDRSASAHGTVAHVVFLDPLVVSYALQIPVAYKIKQNTEKWILRLSMEGLLPESILQRRKAKFWEGAGVQNLLADYAEQKITDADYQCEKTLMNGWQLNSKEELFYYRMFREQFGEMETLDWMGRTKSTP